MEGPQQWSVEDSLDPRSYRGITITSILGKVLEHTILERKTTEMAQEQHPLQFGFTKDKSPMMASLLCTEAIAEGMDNKTPIYLAALDSQKAFDVVDHTSLKVKLYNQSTDSTMWKTETLLLEGLSGVVRVEGGFSRSFRLHQGVGQGKVLSPTQYKAYLHDGIRQLSESNIGAFIGHIPIIVPTCANDMILLAFSRHDLQVGLSTSNTYSGRERFIIHPVKTQVTALLSKEGDADSWTLGETKLHVKESIVHLGLNRKGDKNYTDYIVKDRVNAARGALYSLMGAGLHGLNGLPPRVGRIIHTLYVLPVLLHGLETLTLTQSHLETLELFHRDTIKRLQTLPTRAATYGSFLLLGIAPLEAYIDRRIAMLVGRIASQPGSTLHSVLTRQLAIKDTRSKSWFVYTSGRLAP